MTPQLRIGVIADFNAQNLVGILNKQMSALGGTVTGAPFGQVMQTLADPSAPFWARQYDLLIVWTSPPSISPTFADVIDVKPWSIDALMRDVERFAQNL